MKRLLEIILIIKLIILPLYAEKETRTEGYNNTKLTLSLKKTDLIKDNEKHRIVQKKNFDRIESDEAGRISKIISNDKGITHFKYSEYGYLLSRRKGDIEVENYFYDKLGRNVKIELKNKHKKDSVEFKYTTPVKSFKLGHLSEKIERYEHSFYKFDRNKLLEESKTINGKKFVIKYKHNDIGMISGIHYPSGLIISYEYDEKYNIKTTTATIEDRKICLTKHKRNNDLISTQYGNGLNTIFKVNRKGRSILLRTGDIQEMEFKFNEKGLVNKVKDFKDIKKKKDFYYDHLDRLITAYGPWGKISYRYDSVDNLTEKVDVNNKWCFNYYKKSSRIKELYKNDIKIKVKYDQLGRMIKYGNMSFGYNNRGRLEKIIKKGQILAELYYNIKGQRVVEKRRDVEYYYIYDDKGHLLAKYDNKVGLLMEYIYERDKTIAFVKNKKIYYYHYDLMNFPKIVSNEYGKVYSEIQYKPYGEIFSVAGNSNDLLRYPGQYEIVGTDLYYNLNRTYFPKISGYLEPDPVLNFENKYQYAAANPIKFFDPKGTKINVYFSLQEDSVEGKEPYVVKFFKIGYKLGAYVQLKGHYLTNCIKREYFGQGKKHQFYEGFFITQFGGLSGGLSNFAKWLPSLSGEGIIFEMEYESKKDLFKEPTSDEFDCKNKDLPWPVRFLTGNAKIVVGPNNKMKIELGNIKVVWYEIIKKISLPDISGTLIYGKTTHSYGLWHRDFACEDE